MNETEFNPPNCQLQALPRLASGKAALPPMSLRQRLRLFARRHVSVPQRRRLHAFFARFGAEPVRPVQPMSPAEPLSAGDWVRVRPHVQIEATLSAGHQLKGCAFMGEMTPYCGTTQRVFKRVERFVDERDYGVRKARGIVLLEGALCQGTADYGRCDRSCFFFWREEWLEKIDPVDAQGAAK